MTKTHPGDVVVKRDSHYPDKVLLSVCYTDPASYLPQDLTAIMTPATARARARDLLVLAAVSEREAHERAAKEEQS